MIGNNVMKFKPFLCFLSLIILFSSVSNIFSYHSSENPEEIMVIELPAGHNMDRNAIYKAINEAPQKKEKQKKQEEKQQINQGQMGVESQKENNISPISTKDKAILTEEAKQFPNDNSHEKKTEINKKIENTSTIEPVKTGEGENSDSNDAHNTNNKKKDNKVSQGMAAVGAGGGIVTAGAYIANQLSPKNTMESMVRVEAKDNKVLFPPNAIVLEENKENEREKKEGEKNEITAQPPMEKNEYNSKKIKKGNRSKRIQRSRDNEKKRKMKSSDFLGPKFNQTIFSDPNLDGNRDEIIQDNGLCKYGMWQEASLCELEDLHQNMSINKNYKNMPTPQVFNASEKNSQKQSIKIPNPQSEQEGLYFNTQTQNTPMPNHYFQHNQSYLGMELMNKEYNPYPKFIDDNLVGVLNLSNLKKLPDHTKKKEISIIHNKSMIKPQINKPDRSEIKDRSKIQDKTKTMIIAEDDLHEDLSDFAEEESSRSDDESY